MRVLLIEDHTQLAGLVSQELREKYGYEMTSVRDPLSAQEACQDAEYDLAIVDLLYGHLNEEFYARCERREVGATGSRLLITGLLAARDLSAAPHRTKIVVWTSGEANRRLHLLYAYEELGLRVYCSKSSGGGTADTLLCAIRAAAEGREFADPVLNSYLPGRGDAKIGATIMKEPARRAVWRALALGAFTRGEISKITGYSKRTIGNHMPEMLSDLIAFDPGIRPAGAPMAQVASYASRNWEFFLDDVVRDRWP